MTEMTIVEMAEAEGSYQDIEVNGKLIVKGFRDCKNRWEFIQPLLKPGQTVLDIGSHYGYFAMKAARRHPSSLIWSVEADATRAEIQRLALLENDVPNVVLSHRSLDLVSLLKLQRTCETVDTILAFSVIHYFPLDEIPEILWAFARLAPNLIIEFPVAAETDVANKELVDALEPEYLLGLLYASVRKIGETPSPRDPHVSRPLFLAQNYRVTRETCMSYWSAMTGGHHTVVYDDAAWTIDGRPKQFNGVNVANLRHFNVVYPDSARWWDEAAQRYADLVQMNSGAVTDIHPRNLILSPNGVHPIDYSEHVDEPIYGMEWAEYRQAVTRLTRQEIADGLRSRFDADSLPALLNNEAG